MIFQFKWSYFNETKLVEVVARGYENRNIRQLSINVLLPYPLLVMLIKSPVSLFRL